MKKDIIKINYRNGLIEGVYLNAGENTPLVIIANGHNGFYNYGMFPYIQEGLSKKKISSYSFNYSHGGTIGDSDYFARLDLYEKNCMRLEKEDILEVLSNDKILPYTHHRKVFVLTHSLGGVPTIFAAKEAENLNITLNGIILVNSINSLNVWPKTMMDAWIEKRVYYLPNKRTNQDLPQGEEFLSEILQSDSIWNVESAIKKIKMPILIIHGKKDEAVPQAHGEALFEWCKENNKNNELVLIENATHTFNTKHPFTDTSNELEELILVSSRWITSLQG